MPLVLRYEQSTTGRPTLFVFDALGWLAGLLHYTAEGVRAAALLTHVRHNVVFFFALTHDGELLLATSAHVCRDGRRRLDVALFGFDVSHHDGFALGTRHRHHIPIFKAGHVRGGSDRLHH